jgi:hypothetical protein
MDTEKQPRKFFGGLLQRRECMLPTWRGWLLILLIGLGSAFVTATEIHPFLSSNVHTSNAMPGAVLVVEGWLPDYALDLAISEFKANKYSKLYVTGGPLEQGAPLSEFKSHAELGAAILVRKGLSSSTVQAVPASRIGRDRTYNSAVALKNWLRTQGISPTSYHIMSLGVHARRTRLLFEKALGKETPVDITAVEDAGYDPAHWWRTSDGVRTVMSEAISYVYARLFFSPPISGTDISH